MIGPFDETAGSAKSKQQTWAGFYVAWSIFHYSSLAAFVFFVVSRAQAKTKPVAVLLSIPARLITHSPGSPRAPTVVNCMS